MTTDQNQVKWDAPEWVNLAHEWIRSALSQQHITITGAIESIHQQPWSTVLRIPSTEGNLFFKATMSILAHEAAVTAHLASIKPDSLTQLIAVDTAQGWMIMRDGGSRLREILKVQPDLQRWEELLPEYAEVQIAAAQHGAKFLKLDVPDRSLAKLPQLYAQLIAEKDRYRIDLTDGVTAAEYERLLALVDVVKAKCEQLASYAVPESLNHGDLHDGNIFLNDSGYVFFDWGDCSWTHPFFSLRTACVSAENTLNIAEGAPELQRLRDAYLVAWRKFETEARLLEAYGLAEELWSITTALTWHQAIIHMEEARQADYAHVLPALGQELLSLIKTD